MRNLASIRKIVDLSPIENADAIEVATVDGWKVVAQKGLYEVGDLVVYLEIDSWVPHEIAPFLSKGKEPRKYEGVLGERLRTIRLRGQISQGLLLPLSTFDEHHGMTQAYASESPKQGDDLTELLGIKKYEPPVSPQLQGKVRGTFPTSLISKTDQERVQNCFGNIQKRDGRFLTEKLWNEELQEVQERDVVLPDDFEKPTYEKTLKLDGSSITIFRFEDVLRVCSRNMELNIDDDNVGNTFVKMALAYGEKIPNNFAFQGELMGPGVQGNRENLKEHVVYFYDVFDMKEFSYLLPHNRVKMIAETGLLHVPILDVEASIPETLAEVLADAEGESLNHKTREGVVYKSNKDVGFSFKVISNSYLLKSKS